MEEYEVQPRSPMTTSIRSAVRRWFEQECPLPWLEVAPERFALFPDEASRTVALARPEPHRIEALHTTASVALMDDHIVLGTVRDPSTDQGLEAFVEWLATVLPHELLDGGMPIEPGDLTDPELYA